MVSRHVDFKSISTFCNQTQHSSLFKSKQAKYIFMNYSSFAVYKKRSTLTHEQEIIFLPARQIHETVFLFDAKGTESGDT